MQKKFADQMKRLEAALKRSGLDYEELAKRVKIKPESFRKALKGYQGMSEAVITAIEVAAAKKPIPSTPAGRFREATVPYGEPAKMHNVPIISRAQAGQLVQWDELPTEDRDSVASDCPDPDAIAMQVEGDSMEPAYRAGDIIIVMPNYKPTNESLVVVRLSNGDVMFKEIQFLDVEGERFRLLSYNPRYAPLDVAIDQIERAHPVYSVVRKVWDREKWAAQFKAFNGE